MSMANFDSVEKAANGAKLLGALQPGDIWALIAALLFAFVVWSKYYEIKNNKEWQGIRNNQIGSEVAQTEVLKQLVIEMQNLKMMLVKFLIKE